MSTASDRIFRVAHIADRHISARRRLEDTAAICRAFEDQVAEHGVDLVLDAGDFFDAASRPVERDLLAGHLRRLASIAPVVGCTGNHDADLDLGIFNLLDLARPVQVYDRPTVGGHSLAGIGVFRVSALPWFDRATILRDAPADISRDEGIDRATAAARSLLTAFRLKAEAQRSEGMTPLLVAHLNVAGATTSTGQTLIGQTVEISPAELMGLGFEYIGLGHIHRTQEWYDGRIAYAGSPERMNYGEPEAKGWRLVTFESGRFLRNEFIELPARRIELITCDTIEGIQAVMRGSSPGHLRAALVRFRYTVKAEDLHLVDDAAIERALLDAGAHEAKVEAVVLHGEHVRCPEVAGADTLWAKLTAYWAARGIEIGDEQRERLLAKIATMESSDRGAGEVAA